MKNDLINRQAVLDAIDDEINKPHYAKLWIDGALDARARVNTVPDAELCEDAISRQDVVSKLRFWCKQYDGIFRALDEIKELPPVQPKAKTGKWINERWLGTTLIGVTCSNCMVVDSRFSDYCPNCGADMRGEKE